MKFKWLFLVFPLLLCGGAGTTSWLGSWPNSKAEAGLKRAGVVESIQGCEECVSPFGWEKGKRKMDTNKYFASGSGYGSTVNDIYLPLDDYHGATRYLAYYAGSSVQLFVDDGTYGHNGEWVITYDDGDNILCRYYNTDYNGGFPPLTGWVTDTAGVGPAPTFIVAPNAVPLTVTGAGTADANGDYDPVPGEYSAGHPVLQNSAGFYIKWDVSEDAWVFWFDSNPYYKSTATSYLAPSTDWSVFGGGDEPPPSFSGEEDTTPPVFDHAEITADGAHVRVYFTEADSLPMEPASGLENLNFSTFGGRHTGAATRVDDAVFEMPILDDFGNPTTVYAGEVPDELLLYWEGDPSQLTDAVGNQVDNFFEAPVTNNSTLGSSSTVVVSGADYGNATYHECGETAPGIPQFSAHLDDGVWMNWTGTRWIITSEGADGGAAIYQTNEAAFGAPDAAQFTWGLGTEGASTAPTSVVYTGPPLGGDGPEITSFTPDNGTRSVTEVEITGSNFTGATAVTFDGVSASFTVDSPTQITATVPAGATTGLIEVTTPGGTATSGGFFTVAPAAPRGLVAVPSHQKVTLSWDAVTGADSYNVKMGDSEEGPFDVVDTTEELEFEITGLTNGVSKWFTVSAEGQL